jgi:hypothetical protein
MKIEHLLVCVSGLMTASFGAAGCGDEPDVALTGVAFDVVTFGSLVGMGMSGDAALSGAAFVGAPVSLDYRPEVVTMTGAGGQFTLNAKANSSFHIVGNSSSEFVPTVTTASFSVGTAPLNVGPKVVLCERTPQAETAVLAAGVGMPDQDLLNRGFCVFQSAAGVFPNSKPVATMMAMNDDRFDLYVYQRHTNGDRVAALSNGPGRLWAIVPKAPLPGTVEVSFQATDPTGATTFPAGQCRIVPGYFATASYFANP